MSDNELGPPIEAHQHSAHGDGQITRHHHEPSHGPFYRQIMEQLPGGVGFPDQNNQYFTLNREYGQRYPCTLKGRRILLAKFHQHGVTFIDTIVAIAQWEKTGELGFQIYAHVPVCNRQTGQVSEQLVAVEWLTYLQFAEQNHDIYPVDSPYLIVAIASQSSSPSF